jgi:hypothetical protein
VAPVTDNTAEVAAVTTPGHWCREPAVTTTDKVTVL